MPGRPLISSLRLPKPNVAYSLEMQPSYRRSRLEAVVAGVIWFVCGCWVIGISFYLGYAQPARSIGGVPHWILWGVFVPWVVFFLIHCWYSLVFMRDDSASERQAPPSAE